MEKVTVGICARNEEKTIENCLKSVLAGIQLIQDCESEILINTSLLSDGENLVEAERCIVNNFAADFYIFIDADTIIEKECLNELLKTLKKSNKIIATYAKYIPHKLNNDGFIRKVNRFYDTQAEFQTKRYYLHGRVFATRIWYIPKEIETKNRLINSNSVFLKNLTEKDKTLIVDDIYLSSFILDNFGVNSIKETPTAVAYYEPMKSIKDMYRVYRRRNIEMKKMFQLYPEFNYLLPYLNRSINWNALIAKDAKFYTKAIWIYFIFQRFLFKLILKLEMILVVVKFKNATDQWKIAESTKTIVKSVR